MVWLPGGIASLVEPGWELGAGSWELGAGNEDKRGPSAARPQSCNRRSYPVDPPALSC